MPTYRVRIKGGFEVVLGEWECEILRWCLFLQATDSAISFAPTEVGQLCRLLTAIQSQKEIKVPLQSVPSSPKSLRMVASFACQEYPIAILECS